MLCVLPAPTTMHMHRCCLAPAKLPYEVRDSNMSSAGPRLADDYLLGRHDPCRHCGGPLLQGARPPLVQATQASWRLPLISGSLLHVP